MIRAPTRYIFVSVGQKNKPHSGLSVQIRLSSGFWQMIFGSSSQFQTVARIERSNTTEVPSFLPKMWRSRAAPIVELVFLTTLFLGVVNSLICTRRPANTATPKSPVDENYVISVSGNPETYILGQEYNGERRVHWPCA